MSEQITTILKRKLDDLAASGNIDAEISRNALKEELQFYVLNFIYHHPQYNSWVMYGGSALRIIHGLDRMSVDLDFEIPHEVTETFLDELKKEIEDHFNSTYAAGYGFLTIKITNGRGLILKFNLDQVLSAGFSSKQVHVKIDLNHFVSPKTVTERRPINHDQLSFVILTYNMSTLMASKLVAIFLRGARGVGEATYEEKGRDIYDLLWYMNKKIVPDIDYLITKKVEEAKDLRTLFDKLTLQMNKVSDENLKQDLRPLFINRNSIDNWLKNWRESYFRLLENYEIHTVKEFESCSVHEHFSTDNFSFTYLYKTENGSLIRIICTISDYWIVFREGDLSIEPDPRLVEKLDFRSDGVSSRPISRDKINRYATLFLQKVEKYFEKTNHIMVGDSIDTKIIRMTADNLNQKEQIVLNKSTLLSCDLDDLLK
jgi:hypothetical protein